MERPTVETSIGFCCPWNGPWKNALYKTWKSQLFLCTCPQQPLLQEGLQMLHILIQGIWLPGILFYKKACKRQIGYQDQLSQARQPCSLGGRRTCRHRPRADGRSPGSIRWINSRHLIWEGGVGVERWVWASDTELRGYDQEALMSLPVNLNRGHEMLTAAVGL